MRQNQINNSYVSLEARILQHHLIRKMRAVVDKALDEMEPEFDGILRCGRSSFYTTLATDSCAIVTSVLHDPL